MPKKKRGYYAKDSKPKCEMCCKPIHVDEHRPTELKRLYYRAGMTLCYKCKEEVDSHKTTPDDIEYERQLVLHMGLDRV